MIFIDRDLNFFTIKNTYNKFCVITIIFSIIVCVQFTQITFCCCWCSVFCLCAFVNYLLNQFFLVQSFGLCMFSLKQLMFVGIFNYIFLVQTRFAAIHFITFSITFPNPKHTNNFVDNDCWENWEFHLFHQHNKCMPPLLLQKMKINYIVLC